MRYQGKVVVLRPQVTSAWYYREAAVKTTYQQSFTQSVAYIEEF